MTKKWTPGPWRASKMSRAGTAHRVWRNDLPIDTVADGNPNYWKIADNVHSPADAILISASPDMYEALDELLTEYGGSLGNDPVVLRARAALAKARGQS